MSIELDLAAVPFGFQMLLPGTLPVDDDRLDQLPGLLVYSSGAFFAEPLDPRGNDGLGPNGLA